MIMRAGSISPQMMSETASTVFVDGLAWDEVCIGVRREKASLTSEVCSNNDVHNSRLEVASKACTVYKVSSRLGGVGSKT